MNTCLLCNIEIPRGRKFCSRSHSVSFSNKGKRKWGNAPGVCTICGEPKSRFVSKFCSNKCQGIALREAKDKNPTIKKAVNYLKYYYKRRDILINLLGGKCFVCGSVDKLQFDHKDPKLKTRNISTSIRRHSVREEILKCQLLCKACHLKKSKAEGSLGVRGTRNHNSKLSPEIVRNIRLLLSAGESLRKIGILYKVSGATIYAIKAGLTWKEV
jgi:hypothetical protein